MRKSNPVSPIFISNSILTFVLLNSVQIFEASAFYTNNVFLGQKSFGKDVTLWSGATSPFGHVSGNVLYVRSGLQTSVFNDKKFRFLNSVSAKAYSESTPDDFVNSANPIAGVARLVSQSIAANTQSLANQIEKPGWIQRGGPWAADVYQRIADQDFDGALRLLTNWEAAGEAHEEILLALWRLIPSEVSTMDQVYLEASKALNGDDVSVGTKLTQWAR
jgi:hypothetical protein